MAAQSEAAMQAALKMLAAGPRTRADLLHRLVSRGYALQDAEECVSRLEQMGYVDDESFSEYWVEVHQQRTPSGAALLRQHLLQKGVSAEVVERVLGRVLQEETAALSAGRLYLARSRPGNRDTVAAKLASHLRTRGFEYDIITKTVRDLLEAGPE